MNKLKRGIGRVTGKSTEEGHAYAWGGGGIVTIVLVVLLLILIF